MARSRGPAPPASAKPVWTPPPKMAGSDQQLARVRPMCMAYPETEERLSHSAPTFFARKPVFCMFVDNHHGDERLAVWLPAPPGFQQLMIDDDPATFFKPPYVGPKGWIGVVLNAVDDAALAHYIRQAWVWVAPKTLQKQIGN
jgi:hypothetical protein